jgi:hypothetical protein
MVSYMLAGILFAQQTEPTKETKHVTALVAQIRRLAAPGPVVYGIDTRMKAAEQDHLRVGIVQHMAPLDLVEAERSIASIRRGGDEDYVADAYDELGEILGRTHGDTREMISKGLHAGGFRSASARKELEDSKATNPSAAVEMFSGILGASPAQSPAGGAGYRPGLERGHFPEIADQESGPAENAAGDCVALNVPDLSDMSYSDARTLKDPAERVAALIDIYRRETITDSRDRAWHRKRSHRRRRCPLPTTD